MKSILGLGLVRAIPLAGVVVGAATLGVASLARGLLRRNRLRGKTALVCGASRGLGRLVALELARRGARVAITARSPSDLEAVRAEIARAGGTVFAAACDLRELGQVTEMIAEVKRELGPIEVLVTNAATIEVGPLEAMDAGDFDEALRSIFDTALHPTLAVVPEMRERHAGAIAIVASIGGKIAVPHLAPYTTAKFALVGFGQSLRAELSPHGIDVLTIVPGLMRTGSYAHAHFKGAAEDELAWFGATSTSPLTAMSATRAARRIVRAIERGDRELVLGATAKLATRLNGLAPGLVSFVTSLAARFLPALPSDPAAKVRLREGADLERGSESPAIAALRARGVPLQREHHQRGAASDA